MQSTVRRLHAQHRIRCARTDDFLPIKGDLNSTGADSLHSSDDVRVPPAEGLLDEFADSLNVLVGVCGAVGHFN